MVEDYTAAVENYMISRHTELGDRTFLYLRTSLEREGSVQNKADFNRWMNNINYIVDWRNRRLNSSNT